MNPYLENQNLVKPINEEIKKIQKEIDLLISKQYELQEEVWALTKCTHKDLNSNSMIERTGQCPGSGKTEYLCTICYSSDV